VDRRKFIGTLAGSLLVAPLAAEAQPTGKVPRIALVFANAPVADLTGPRPAQPNARAFLEAMRELGWIDGQNITIERRSAEGRPDRYAGLAQELLRLKVDLIVCPAASLTQSIQQATSAIPIVIAGAFVDPVAEAGVKSLARPGGNLTGLTMFSTYGKRLELLKEAVPGISRVAFLGNLYVPGPTIAAVARALKLALVPVVIPTPEELQKGFATIERARVDALFVADTATFFPAARGALVEFAAKQRLPASYPFDVYVEAGGLMSYGVDFNDIFRRAAIYVDKILKGANPGDLPIEQPTKMDLMINLKTAKALGLTIPPSLLQRADQVIE
jgi:putative tryptophan/tyrosine transport system substrate-binding protein